MVMGQGSLEQKQPTAMSIKLKNNIGKTQEIPNSEIL